MNNYRFDNENCYIQIKNKHGFFDVIIDLDDYNRVKNIDWFVIKSATTYYCVGHIGYGSVRYFTRLHRLIMSYPEIFVDHINCDGLDNRKINLRTATPQQNSFNRRNLRNNLPKGVSLTKNGKRYQAHIGNRKTFLHLGTFDSIKEAALAYNNEAFKRQGSYAKLNDLELFS